MIDLFETPEVLPKKLQTVLINAGEISTYNQCATLLRKVRRLGYTFDYYLDGVPYNLRKLTKAENGTN